MLGDVTCQMYLGQKVMLGYCRVPESSNLSCAEITVEQSTKSIMA